MRNRTTCRRLTSALLACVFTAAVGWNGVFALNEGSGGATDEDNVIYRIADGDTTDSYKDMLLNETNGARYAGRIWTDKSVFAYGDAANGSDGHTIGLDYETDGYNGSVSYNADFGHVFSALASSQVVNEYPPSPIDLVIAFDMSASMAQDTRYDIGANENYADADRRTMAERIENSRINKTVAAINATIDALMAQNPQNRVSICAYGAGADVIMPLAHYRKNDNGDPYLTVGGMETLYSLDDLVYENGRWLWKRNRDACYTVEAHAVKNTYTGVLSKVPSEPGNKWESYDYIVSNNVDNDKVKARPGYGDQTEDNLSKGENASHIRLTADRYIGYFTNTQGGIFLAYQQLAKTPDLTYTEKLTNGKDSTVARIPAAIIMSDGGANFAFNKMDHWSEDGETTDGFYYGSFDSENNSFIGDQRHWKGEVEDARHRLTSANVDDDIRHNVGDEWYKVYLPGVEDKNRITSLYNMGMELENGELNTPPVWDLAGIFYSNDNDVFGTSGAVLQTIMTASYMKTVVDKHYKSGWEKDRVTEASKVPLNTYTVSVDAKHVPQWGRLRLYPIMDPKNYFLDNSHWGDETKFGSDTTIPFYPAYGKTQIFTGAMDSWKQWASGSETLANANSDQIKIRISPLPKEGDSTYGEIVTNEDVVKNLAYSDGFFDIESDRVVDIFGDILSLITGKIFIPVSGKNEAGVSDSITYQDPIGDYMEIKDRAIKFEGRTEDMSLLLFGKMYGMVRTAIYDFRWNDEYMKVTSPGTQGVSEFAKDWYKGDDPTAVQKANSPDGLPPGCASAQDAWNNGWVYRIGFGDLLDYIPAAMTGVIDPDNMKPENLTEQVKNTVYTIYRFDFPGMSSAEAREESGKLRMNPIYGEEVPEDLRALWDGATDEQKRDNRLYKDYDGVYRLSDIRVWTEEYGDYVDTEGVIAPNASAYDSSLYVDIPAKAVPSQFAEITLGKAGVLSYKTNLDNKEQATPLRLFYGVGLQDRLIERDSQGNQIGVNEAAISEEYLESHRSMDNSIWFLSNYYSNTPYVGYDESAAVTRGDPAVSFSASADNRYYTFQKPLPLYAHAYRVRDGNPSPVDNTVGWTSENVHKGGNGETTWENYGDAEQSGGTWIGGEFMGTYNSEADFKSAKERMTEGIITDSQGGQYRYVDDGIIFMTDDLVDKVRSKDGGGYTDDSISFSSEDYFFIVIEYYRPNGEPGKDLNGNAVAGATGGDAIQYVVARKGSMFGSGLHSVNIDNGDMLCWTDMNGHAGVNAEYYSRTDTGDDTRGEPTFEKLTYKSGDLRDYLKNICHIRDDNAPDGGKSSLDTACEYWTEMQTLLNSEIEKAAGSDGKLDAAEFSRYFQWAVAAKPGGLRVGDMYQSRKIKDSNTTETAYSYYVPTISSTASVGEGIVVNNFMGNNGKLAIADQAVLATKQIESPGGELSEEEENEKFEYQVYIQNALGSIEAVNTWYNEYANSWQRRIASIDLLTDNSDLILNSDSERALFEAVRSDGADVEGNKAYTGKLVVPMINGTSGATEYYYANEDGTPGERCYTPLSELYYLYIPREEESDNPSGGQTNEFARRIYEYSEESGMSTAENCGVTTFFPEGASAGAAPGPDNRIGYSPATEDRPAGTRTYWLLDAEMIPVSEVTAAEQTGSGGDADASESIGWRHGDKVNDDHKHMGSFDVILRRPMKGTTKDDIVSPFKTRTEYLTTMLKFGVKADGTPLTETDIYDGIVPTADRPAFEGTNLKEIAAHTAEFTLKHNEGLLITGLENNLNYRFTEKLTDEQKKVYRLRELSHIQNYGSESVYRLGMQKIPVYTKEGARYPAGTAAGGHETQNGLTWALNADGTEHIECNISYEPFNHTNATLWESYSTLRGSSDNKELEVIGNHHNPADAAQKQIATTYIGDEAQTGSTETVGDNPSCASVDATQPDGSVRHYMYKEGQLVDPHYEGEWTAFLRNANRYVVGPTVHFAVEGETQDDAETTLPAAASTRYTGVYSAFGNTGAYEEAAHFINEPIVLKGSIAVTKVTGKGDILPGAGFTLYEVDAEGNKIEPEHKTDEIFTELMYMQPLAEGAEGYDRYSQTYTDPTVPSTSYPVRRNEDGALYYFVKLTDEEKQAFEDGTLQSKYGKEPDRVRAVAEFKDLDVSKRYKLEETTIPDGYVLTHQPSEIFEFEVGAENPLLNILYEVKNFDPLVLPNTGGIIGLLVLLGAMLTALAIYLARKRGKNGKSPPRSGDGK